MRGHVSVCVQLSEEAVSTAIGYLMIFMQHVSNVQLMREFLQFLTIGMCDGGKSVLNCLIQNMNSSTRKVKTIKIIAMSSMYYK